MRFNFVESPIKEGSISIIFPRKTDREDIDKITTGIVKAIDDYTEVPYIDEDKSSVPGTKEVVIEFKYSKKLDKLIKHLREAFLELKIAEYGVIVEVLTTDGTLFNTENTINYGIRSSCFRFARSISPDVVETIWCTDDTLIHDLIPEEISRYSRQENGALIPAWINLKSTFWVHGVDLNEIEYQNENRKYEFNKAKKSSDELGVEMNWATKRKNKSGGGPLTYSKYEYDYEMDDEEREMIRRINRDF